MKQTKLNDGTKVFCLRSPEAKMLDHHVDGYLQHGISINENDVIFDVGANIGVFGVRATQKQKNVTVHSFEPIPDIAEALRMNASTCSSGNIVVHQCGLSSSAGNVEFTYFPNTPALSTFKPEEWDDQPNAFTEAVKGTMKNPPPEMKWMKWIPTFFAPLIAKSLVKGKKQVNCELKTMSSVIDAEQVNEINLLKVDCEGAELSVLEGIRDEHWPMIQSTVIEIHDKDNRLETIKSMLTNQGFSSIHVEREQGLENTQLYNLFATRK